MTSDSKAPLVSIVMGSTSDGPVADKAVEVLRQFGVPFEIGIKSAHRTPRRMMDYASGLADRGVQVVIAIAGGSAHLPGMVASETSIPVLAVPVRNVHKGHGDEARKSSIAMPPGVPLAVMGDNAADRAALFCVRMLATSDSELHKRYLQSQQDMADSVARMDAKIEDVGWDEFLEGDH